MAVKYDDPLTQKIIGCAIEVHKQLGAGLLEALYEEALIVEFELQSLKFQRQVELPVNYKGKLIGQYRLDLLVEDAVVIEIKSVERHDAIFEAQLLTDVTQNRATSLTDLGWIARNFSSGR